MFTLPRTARGAAARRAALVACLAPLAAALPLLAQTPHVVAVRAYDYGFRSPPSVPAGTITFRLTNEGKEVHHLWIVRLNDGKTPAEFLKVMNAWGSALKMPDWALDVGGPNNVGSGQTADGTMTLDPGTYMLVCWVQSPDGRPHVMKGMVKPLRVTAQPASGVAQQGTAAAEPTPDVLMTLDDYGFEVSGPIKAGRRTLRFENRAAQSHEAVIARLLPDKTLMEAVVWMNAGQAGPSPVEMLGGASGIAKGRHMFITANFAPGKYVLLCFIPDAKDGKPHSAHGMAKEITVEP
jgi:uncharacterized cupredoxin-like copper-binding protein